LKQILNKYFIKKANRVYLVTYENLKLNINFILKIIFNNNYNLISAVNYIGASSESIIIKNII